MKIALCYSGGMDSRVMAKFAELMMPGAEVVGVWWDYGQKAATGERRHLPFWVKQCKMTWLGEPGVEGYVSRSGSPYGAIYTPGRNLALAVNTAVLTLADEIWLGGLADEAQETNATDKDRQFCEFAGAAISYVLSPWMGPVTVKLPLAEAGMTKWDAVRWALEHDVSPTELLNTWSCYGPGPVRCGTCLQCKKRHAISLLMTGLDDTEYLVAP